MSQMEQPKLLLTEHKDVLIKELEKEYPGSQTSQFEYDGKKYLSIVVDTGFGIYRKHIFLYMHYDSDRYGLLIFRSTNTSSIKIETDEEGISIFSKQGEKLVFLPKKGLVLAFDKLEQ